MDGVGVGLAPFVVSLMFMICMHTYFHNIYALQSHSTPSSSMNSTSTRKLKVGVPWKTGFREFVSVKKNGTNYIFGGFCVKVFEAAIQTLNYSVHYIPLKYEVGETIRWSYDSIIHEIMLKV